MNIRVIEPTSGKTFDVDLPQDADLAEIRRRIAAAVASAVEICELYQERTGKLISTESIDLQTPLQDGEIIKLLPRPDKHSKANTR
jgi:small-conductance mechanosensitive channel